MAAANRNDARRELTRSAAIALALCCAFGVAVFVFELEPATVIADEVVPLAPRSVYLSDDIAIDGPTVVRVELTRAREEGFVGAHIALVDDDSGEAYEVQLGTEVRAGIDIEAAHTRVQHVTTGTYHLRIVPTLIAGATARVPSVCRVRLIEGDRSPALFAVALALLLAPLGLALVRYLKTVKEPEPWTSAPS